MHFPAHWNLASSLVSPLEAITKITKSFQFMKSNWNILEIILHYLRNLLYSWLPPFLWNFFSLDFYNSFPCLSLSCCNIFFWCFPELPFQCFLNIYIIGKQILFCEYSQTFLSLYKKGCDSITVLLISILWKGLDIHSLILSVLWNTKLGEVNN